MRFLGPDLYHRDIHSIDLEGLRAVGVEVLLVDLDNTLLPRDSSEVPRELEEWVGRVRDAGLGICLVSNNRKGHVRGVARRLGIPLVARAVKPFPFAFARALRVLGARPSRAAVIGDQVFTDIVGGRIIGAARTVLVDPISGSDLPHTRLLRGMEARIMAGRDPEERLPGGEERVR